MRPQDVVVGLERNVSERGRLEEQEQQFELERPEAYDEAVAESRLDLRAHHDAIMGAVLAIIERREVSLDELELSEQEQSALEALRTAFDGKDPRYAEFVYAEQRRELLEQALAALQPALALDLSHASELRLTYDRIVEEVTELRERLEQLEDAQDDERLHETQVRKDAPKDEDDVPDEVEGAEGAAKPSTVWQPGEAGAPGAPGAPGAQDAAATAASPATKPSSVWQPGEPDAQASLAATAVPRPSSVWQPDEAGAPGAPSAPSAQDSPDSPAGAERPQGRGMLSRLSRALGLGKDDRSEG